jgi:hypothetical protein
MSDENGKKFRHPAGVAIRTGLDRRRYLKTKEGKAEKKARKEHNKKFSATVDKKTKLAIKRAAKKSDAAKGASLRKTGFLPHEIVDNRKTNDT